MLLGPTSIGLVAEPLPGSVSPPPVTTAPFTTVPAALGAITAAPVISGKLADGGSASARPHVRVVTTQVYPEPHERGHGQAWRRGSPLR